MYDDWYVIDIQSVSGDMVTLDYHIHEPLGNGSNSVFSLNGNGTFSIAANEQMKIIFDLPDGFYGINGTDTTNTAYFFVRVDPQKGCCTDHRYGIFSHRPYVRSY